MTDVDRHDQPEGGDLAALADDLAGLQSELPGGPTWFRSRLAGVELALRAYPRDVDSHLAATSAATPPQERARCQRCGNVVRLVTESHIVGGVDEDGEGEECDADSDEWEATDALPPQQAANEGGDWCAEMRRRGDAISALCWALRQGADPVETAQKIGGHAANIAVHYGLPAPSVATLPDDLGSAGFTVVESWRLERDVLAEGFRAELGSMPASEYFIYRLSDAVRRNVLVPAAPPPTEGLRACFGICDHVDCLP